MNRSRFHRTFKIFRRHMGANILRKDIKVKEELLLNRLEEKLGKSKEEIKQLLSEDLMKLLTKVPFSH
jgi:hypothetical protein